MLDFKGNVEAGKKVAHSFLQNFAKYKSTADWAKGNVEDLDKLQKYISRIKVDSSATIRDMKLPPDELKAALEIRVTSFKNMITNAQILNDPSLSDDNPKKKEALSEFQKGYNNINKINEHTALFNNRVKIRSSFADEYMQFMTNQGFNLTEDLNAYSLTKVISSVMNLEGMIQQRSTLGRLNEANDKLNKYEASKNEIEINCVDTLNKMEEYGYRLSEKFNLSDLKDEQLKVSKELDLLQKSGSDTLKREELNQKLERINKSYNLGEQLFDQYRQVEVNRQEASDTSLSSMNSANFENIIKGLEAVSNNINTVKRATRHQNTPQYTQMINSINDTVQLLKDPTIFREQKIEQLKKCKALTDTYLAAKKAQKFVINSDMRKARMASASLVSMAINSELERQNAISASKAFKDVKEGAIRIWDDEPEVLVENDKQNSLENVNSAVSDKASQPTKSIPVM